MLMPLKLSLYPIGAIDTIPQASLALCACANFAVTVEPDTAVMRTDSKLS